jgi:site-specific recombinase XerD
MRFDEATKQFLAYCDLERGFSPCTISAYASDLRQWHRFLAKALPGNIPRITDVDRQLVRRFIVHQRETGLSNATVARRVNCLRSFWQLLCQAELVTDTPLDGIRLPKTRTELPTFLTDEEMRRLLQAAGRTHYANLAARDQAVIGTFLFAGLRRQELINVHVRDVSWEDGILRVRHGKGGTARHPGGQRTAGLAPSLVRGATPLSPRLAVHQPREAASGETCSGSDPQAGQAHRGHRSTGGHHTHAPP